MTLIAGGRRQYLHGQVVIKVTIPALFVPACFATIRISSGVKPPCCFRSSLGWTKVIEGLLALTTISIVLILTGVFS